MPGPVVFKGSEKPEFQRCQESYRFEIINIHTAENINLLFQMERPGLTVPLEAGISQEKFQLTGGMPT